MCSFEYGVCFTECASTPMNWKCQPVLSQGKAAVNDLNLLYFFLYAYENPIWRPFTVHHSHKLDLEFFLLFRTLRRRLRANDKAVQLSLSFSFSRLEKYANKLQ